MKKILLLLLTAITLIGCEKEETGLLYNDGLVKSLEFQREASQINEKIIIQYDAQDRVLSINDTVFFYGLDDKVIYSRYSEKIDEEGRLSEKIIKKSYQWDQQGRILAIHVDSNYHRIVDTKGIARIENVAPVVEAHFYYTGLQRLPDSIGQGLGSAKVIFKRLYHSSGNINKIEDIQPIDKVTSDLPNSVVVKSTFFDYNDDPNYLFPLFQKLGFLPRSLGYVAARKLVSSSEVVESVLFNNFDDHLDTKRVVMKNIYTNSKSSNGYPSLIQMNSMVDFDGSGYGNAGSYTTYIHY